MIMDGFGQRSREPELLDQGVSDEEVQKSLADLRFVNRWLSNTDQLVRAVLGLLEPLPRPSLLDVGCGSADLLESIRRRCPHRLHAVGVDIKRKHLDFIPSTVQCVVSDVRQLPFPEESFDVVMASHFLHHFDDDELADVLRALFSLARCALVISDLRRAQVPYLFGRVAFPLLFASRVSVNDGLISIRRGFRNSELMQAFDQAGIPVEIRRCWPYRLLAVAKRD